MQCCFEMSEAVVHCSERNLEVMQLNSETAFRVFFRCHSWDWALPLILLIAVAVACLVVLAHDLALWVKTIACWLELGICLVGAPWCAHWMQISNLKVDTANADCGVKADRRMIKDKLDPEVSCCQPIYTKC